jgi:hypothetical protein
MTEKLIQIAIQVSNPLALAGLIAALFFLLAREMLSRGLFPQLAQSAGGKLLRHVVDRFFVLALVAMVLGFTGFALGKILETHKRDGIALRKFSYAYEQGGHQYSGYFQEMEGSAWVEFTKEPERDLTYYFREVEGEAGWITLYDSGRKAYVRLRKGGGWCQYTTNPEGPWYNIHLVAPATSP